MEGVQAYIQETELSRRVQQWESKIRPILMAEVVTLCVCGFSPLVWYIRSIRVEALQHSKCNL